jgi:putative nucleotidyltransferase with HDIG domain
VEHDGGDRSLEVAFAALDDMPVLAESRRRLARVAARVADTSIDHLVAVVEPDLTLALAVLRAAANIGPVRPRSVREAVQTLGAQGVPAAVSNADELDPLVPGPGWRGALDGMRLHGLAVQRAAERVMRDVPVADRDGIVTAALLHDVGKLVLVAHARDYFERVGWRSVPEVRLAYEREVFGVDHDALGGAVLRRWRLGEDLVLAVELHHAEPAHHHGAAVVRLADMLAHYENHSPIDIEAMLAVAARLGLDREAIATLLYELPHRLPVGAAVDKPCPLSTRELDVLRRLAEGKVYKQIALDEGISPSTVRNHLHAAYSKLGVVDRAQAVLMAREHGWI